MIERRTEQWTMWKDVLATFVGALAALAGALGPIGMYVHTWMRDRDRAEAALVVRVDGVEKREASSAAARAEDRRELIDRLARIEGLLLRGPAGGRQ